jgi:hypothetical protein
MRVSRLRSAKTLTELVDRLFDLEKSTTGRREIAARIADANHHLDLRRGSLSRRLDKGELIAVPEIAGAVPTRSTQGLTTEAARLLLRESKQGLSRLADAAKQETGDSQAAAEEMVATIDSAPFQQALQADPTLGPRVEELVKATKDRQRRARERADAVDATVGEALDTVERLLRRLR